MADIADDANDLAAQQLLEALAIQKRKAVKLSHKGSCHYCGEKITVHADNQTFCDIDCRDDYEKFVLKR